MSPDPLNHLTFPLDFVEWAEGLKGGEVISLGEWSPGEWVFEMQIPASNRHYRFSVSAGVVVNSLPNWRMHLNWNIERGRRVLTAAGWQGPHPLGWST